MATSRLCVFLLIYISLTIINKRKVNDRKVYHLLLQTLLLRHLNVIDAANMAAV